MLSPLRNRFGIPGVISVIALVFAMLGGAYAASDDSGSGSKASASAKAKKGPRGPKGPKGPVGPAGPQGPAGPAGAKGDTGAAGSNGTNGKDGEDGTDGTDGIDGTSVTTSAASTEECPSGGIKVTSASPPAKVCNGQTGFVETLPSEATEKGTWWFQATNDPEQYAPVSFPIPLSVADAASIKETHVSTEKAEDFEAECPGTINDPKAEPGALCFYINSTEFLNTREGGITGVLRPDSNGEEGIETTGVGTTGVLLFFSGALQQQHMGGTFAVTAP
jgi:Collagen triple helix repeat (20 copies)